MSKLLIIILGLIIIGIILGFKTVILKKNKLLFVLSISTVIIIVLIALLLFIIEHRYDNIKIEDNYYAVLSGGAGEIVNHTYLYIENKNYKYVQTQSSTTYWGSSEWIEKVTKVGKLNSPEDVIEKAKQNSSNGWVQINVDIEQNPYTKTYVKGDIITIEEFRQLIKYIDK